MASNTVTPEEVKLRNSGDNIENAYVGLNEYKPQTEEEIRQQAQDRADSVFEGVNGSLAQSLSNQLSAQDREVYDYGMQRSSYAPALRESLINGGAKATQAVDTARQTTANTLFQSMLDSEYNRRTAARQYRDNLLLQLYQIEHPSSSGGGGGYYSNSDPVTTPSTGGDDSGDKADLSGLKNQYRITYGSNGSYTVTLNGRTLNSDEIPASIQQHIDERIRSRSQTNTLTSEERARMRETAASLQAAAKK